MKQSCVDIRDNGCGKSTFLRAMMQLHPYEGSIHLYDQNIQTLSNQKRHQALQMMLQDPLATFNPYHRLTHITQDPSINLEILLNILKRFGVDIEALYPHQLPRSKIQIISLARTLSRQAQVFLLDEPTSHMSNYATQITIDIIKELQQDGATFILTSHQPEFINALCSDIWTIEQQCLHIPSWHSFCSSFIQAWLLRNIHTNFMHFVYHTATKISDDIRHLAYKPSCTQRDTFVLAMSPPYDHTHIDKKIGTC